MKCHFERQESSYILAQVVGAKIYVMFGEEVKMLVERYFWEKVL